MSTLFPKTNSYYPYNDSTKSKGRITSNYGNIATFVGNIQPMSQKEVDTLGIGRKDMGKVKVYTDTIFTISIEGQENTGDKVVYDSNIYEVIRKDRHTGSLLPHHKYIAELRLNDNLGNG